MFIFFIKLQKYEVLHVYLMVFRYVIENKRAEYILLFLQLKMHAPSYLCYQAILRFTIQNNLVLRIYTHLLQAYVDKDTAHHMALKILLVDYNQA